MNIELLSYALPGAVTKKRKALQTGPSLQITPSTLLTPFRLLQAVREAGHKEEIKYSKTINAVQNDHTEAVIRHITSPTIQVKLLADIEGDCKEIRYVLGNIVKIGEVTPKILDAIVSKGEIMSCRIMVGILQDRDVDAVLIDLAQASDFHCPHGLDQDFYDHLTNVLSSKVINECGNRVPVVTGFFGNIAGGLVNDIGRGYTDLCAALIAVGLGADVLQIWKEVDGVFTANPHIVPSAQLLPTLSPAEAAELSFFGSEGEPTILYHYSSLLTSPSERSTMETPLSPRCAVLTLAGHSSFHHGAGDSR